MKKFFLLLFAVFQAIQFSFAKPIDATTAQTVARHFFRSTDKGNTIPGQLNFDLAFEAKGRLSADAAEETAFYYIFNLIGTEGYVIVGADDVAEPIWAYSVESWFDPVNIPINMEKWIEAYRQEMIYILSHELRATPEIAAKWQQWQAGDLVVQDRTAGVNPLCVTRWDQAPYYNALCPGGSVTGCVATAMAQVMKFWNHPAQGEGFHSYNEDNYGTVSANFGSTSYNWAAMPNSLNSNNTAVATLMYHCGVSVDMNYSPQVSGAYVATAASPITHCSEYAFKTYFKYSPSLQGVLRSNYSSAQWVNLMKSELDAGRPILHAGIGSGGGHAFVCDGYDNADYFHFNWGWGGQADGYFLNYALNPGSTGTGGGSGGYNSNQHILIGVQPVNGGGGGGGSQPASVQLYTPLVPASNPFAYTELISVSANIQNTGNTPFYGDITAALFDENYTFVDFIQTYTESNGLPSGFVYQNNLVFSNGSLDVVPGDYYIGIFVRPTNGNWIQVANGSYQNMIPVSVVYYNDIQMYEPISTSPTVLTRNQPASIHTNIANFGFITFNGTVSVDLHDLDGSWIGTIDEISGLSLPSNSYYINGLTFNTSGLDVDPGTYQIAVWELAAGGSWELVQGSSANPNPQQVTIAEEALSPDVYENNNTQSSAFNLTLNFTGNQATRKTTGANIHLASDYDFFKIALPSGYSYSINARLQDSYDNNDGQDYTNDALWSYSTGGAYSEAFDDVLTTGNIVLNGGQTIYFQIASYFPGNTGTYQFDIQVTRTPVSGTIDLLAQGSLAVRPNPASEFLSVTVNDNVKLQKLELFNTSGQQVLSRQLDGVVPGPIPVHELPGGLYILTVLTDRGLWRERVVITRRF